MGCERGGRVLWGSWACPENGSLGAETGGPNFNLACGYGALKADTSGNNNTATGSEALINDTTGYRNTAMGSGALLQNSEGALNIAIGPFALYSNQTGSNNVAIGDETAVGITGSNNIEISNHGESSDSGTIRIGTEGPQTSAFIAGIFPTHLSGCFVQVQSSGKLGCNPTAAAEGEKGEKGEKGERGEREQRAAKAKGANRDRRDPQYRQKA